MKSLSLIEIATMKFKRKADVDLNELHLDIQMFNVMNVLDGERNIKTIARGEGYDIKELYRKIDKLLKLGAIELVNMKGQCLLEK